MKQFYMVMGESDFVGICEAPDDAVSGRPLRLAVAEQHRSLALFQGNGSPLPVTVTSPLRTMTP
jgi:hypothetical protein